VRVGVALRHGTGYREVTAVAGRNADYVGHCCAVMCCAGGMSGLSFFRCVVYMKRIGCE
jgi:hypothetical protein